MTAAAPLLYHSSQYCQIYCGDAATVLKDSVASESVDCVVTSPDYWQLRGDAEILPGEIGLEEFFTEYINKVMAAINEVHRVLKPTGTFFLVINDTYNTPKVRNTNGIPTSRGSGTVKQKEKTSKNPDDDIYCYPVMKSRNQELADRYRQKELHGLDDDITKIVQRHSGTIVQDVDHTPQHGDKQVVSSDELKEMNETRNRHLSHYRNDKAGRSVRWH